MCNCNQNTLGNVIRLAIIFAKTININQIVYVTNSGVYNYITEEYAQFLNFKLLKTITPNGEITDI